MKKILCTVLCLLLCLSPLFAYAELSPQAQEMLLEILMMDIEKIDFSLTPSFNADGSVLTIDLIDDAITLDEMEELDLRDDMVKNCCDTFGAHFEKIRDIWGKAFDVVIRAYDVNGELLYTIKNGLPMAVQQSPRPAEEVKQIRTCLSNFSDMMNTEGIEYIFSYGQSSDWIDVSIVFSAVTSEVYFPEKDQEVWEEPLNQVTLLMTYIYDTITDTLSEYDISVDVSIAALTKDQVLMLHMVNGNLVQ